MLDIIQDQNFFQEYSFRRSFLHRRENESKKKNEHCLPRLEIEDIVNHEELKNFLEDLKCPICINLIEDPKTCINCEANFCGECIQEWVSQDGDRKCPCCRDQGLQKFLYYRERENRFNLRINGLESNSNKYVPCPKIFKKILNTIQITCHNKGCNTIIKYDERMSHLKECLYQEHNCPNELCEEKITKLTESDHSKVCEYRKEPCQFCKEEFCIKTMIFHEDFCPENKQKCQDCNGSFQIQKLIEHDRVCQYKQIECKICNNKFYRKCFSYHTKAKCYEKLYKNSQRDIKKKDKILQQKDEEILKMMTLIESMRTYLVSSEDSVDKTKLKQEIEEFSKNKAIEIEQNQDDQLSESYPDDFESFEKTSTSNKNDSREEEKNMQQQSEKKKYYPLIKLNEDSQNYAFNYSFDCTIKSVVSDTAQYQSQQSQPWSQQVQAEEEEKNNNEEVNSEFSFERNIKLILQDVNTQEVKSEANHHEDSYLQEIFVNSQDRKDFFSRVEENLLL